MAITKVTKIKTNITAALSYIAADKSDSENKDFYEFETEQGMAPTGRIYRTMTSTLNLRAMSDQQKIEKEFTDRIEHFAGYSERGVGRSQKSILAYHLIQNFGQEVPTVVAHEIGRKLAEELCGTGYQAEISTHTNTGKTHNHIIISAYDSNGKKLNYNDAFYQRIRTVSDRLCREYKLPVLEETSEQKKLRYIDKNGKLRSYEPTARKNGQRERVSLEYENQKPVRDRVRRDIDTCLRYATDYYDLLGKMESLGYQIKWKTKRGSWLKHVVFKPAYSEQGIRDSSLGEFYTRESLTAYIAELQRMKKEELIAKNEYVPYVSRYIYKGRQDPLPDRTWRVVKYQDVSGMTDYKIRHHTKEEMQIVRRMYDISERIPKRDSNTISDARVNELIREIQIGYRLYQLLDNWDGLAEKGFPREKVVEYINKRDELKERLKALRRQMNSPAFVAASAEDKAKAKRLYAEACSEMRVTRYAISQYKTLLDFTRIEEKYSQKGKDTKRTEQSSLIAKKDPSKDMPTQQPKTDTSQKDTVVQSQPTKKSSLADYQAQIKAEREKRQEERNNAIRQNRKIGRNRE